MDKIVSIANKHRLVLIEDCCQAHGACFRNINVGSFGVGCFSFYATKNMTTGEGGMVTTNSSIIDERLKLFRSHGSKVQYLSEVLGYNFRLTEFQAAIGIEQLRKLPSFNLKRIENARYLTKGLSGVEGLITPQVDHNTECVFHQYTVRINKNFKVSRDKLRLGLETMGVATKVFYPIPIYQQPIYRKFNLGCFPKTESAVCEVLSLPVHPGLTKKDLDFIIQAIRKFSD